jgi:hypothetical protein
MPFTPAHPSIILPLVKSSRVSATAIIIGSLVPDFEFFFQMREVDNIGHHWYGVFLFDLPVALLFCFLFHNLIRNLLIENLPAILRNRLSFAQDFNWNSYARQNKYQVLFSLLAGIASHILWDGFTHYDGLFVELIPLLATPIKIQNLTMPVYYLLQVVFSLLGLLVVLWAVFKLPFNKEERKTNSNKAFWPALLIIFFSILLIRIIGWPAYNSFWGVFMALMGSICYSLLLVSIFIQKPPFKKQQL